MITDNSLTDRVKMVMENEGFSPTSFADTIGVQRPSMSHILSGRNKPSIDIVQKIITSLPHYNPIWLLNGTGNMLQLNMFESEDDLKEKQNEKAAAANSKEKKKSKSASNKNINFVKQALESNILDDDLVEFPTPVQFQNSYSTEIFKEESAAQETLIQEAVTTTPTNLTSKDFNLDNEEEPITMKENTPNTSTILQNELVAKQTQADMPLISAMFAGTKKVERIVVFYDDKTFAIYNPE